MADDWRVRIEETEKREAEAVAACGLTQMEWLLMNLSKELFREASDIAECIHRELRSEEGWYNHHTYLEVLPLDQLQRDVDAFLARGFLTRITIEVAEQMVEERLDGQRRQDTSVEELVGQFIFSEIGFLKYKEILSRLDYGPCLEETDERWVYRGPLQFTCMDVCTALRDNPTSTICRDLECRIQQIGPYAIPNYAIVIPSGWRLICFRRTR